MIFMPGDRVKVFDHRLYKNDKKTPLSVTMQPATVLMWYGTKTRPLDYTPEFHTEEYWNYPSLIDVKFDYDGRVSRAHFTDFVERM